MNSKSQLGRIIETIILILFFMILLGGLYLVLRYFKLI